jgi:hypothetical protein
MTPAAAARVIEQRLNSSWTGTTIAWPNTAFTPPPTANWLKVDFLWSDGTVTTKNGLNTVTGILQLTVFGPKDAGDGALYTLAESARALFNRVRLASPNQDVMFGAVSGPVGLFEESWRSLVISAPFQVLETVS